MKRQVEEPSVQEILDALPALLEQLGIRNVFDWVRDLTETERQKMLASVHGENRKRLSALFRAAGVDL